MERAGTTPERTATRRHHAVVLVGSLDRRIVPALRLAARLGDADVRALHVSVDPEETRRLARDWMELGLTWLPLHIRDGCSGSFLASVRRAVDEQADATGALTVILPEAEYEQWWAGLLHRRSARRIAWALRLHRRVTTVIVPSFVQPPPTSSAAGGRRSPRDAPRPEG